MHTLIPGPPRSPGAELPPSATSSPERETRPRVSSHDLLRSSRVVEIEHEGKIYELRLTRLNKLILTA